MQQVRSQLACRLASLINGADPTEKPLPDSNSFRMLDTGQDHDVHELSVAEQVAPPIDVDTLAHAHADAYAAGWTMPLLQEVATRLLEHSSTDEIQHPGVAPKRLRVLLPDHLKAQYIHVLRWFDAAHVLAPAVTSKDPFRHPRPIVCGTTAEFITRLLATSYPGVENMLHPFERATED